MLETRARGFRRKRPFYFAFLLSLLGAALCLPLWPENAAADSPRPILFVHGNGDSAALWHTTLWRFESNGYDRSLLFAIDFKSPTARSDDTKPQEKRSSAAEQAKDLGEKVAEVQAKTGQKQVVLVGSSRGGNAIRNYIKNFGGAPMFPMPSCAAPPTTGSRRPRPT
jgi:triacylglycerol esterase/lipase EstA (alpha/beta hydrolase family)